MCLLCYFSVLSKKPLDPLKALLMGAIYFKRDCNIFVFIISHVYCMEAINQCHGNSYRSFHFTFVKPYNVEYVNKLPKLQSRFFIWQNSKKNLFDRILKKKMAMTIEWIPPRPTSCLNKMFGIVCSRKWTLKLLRKKHYFQAVLVRRYDHDLKHKFNYMLISTP